MIATVPGDIIVSQEFAPDTGAPFFKITAFDRIWGGFIKLPGLQDLLIWLDRHDYRYVCGSQGHWRLP